MKLSLYRQSDHLWSLLDPSGQFLGIVNFAPEVAADKCAPIIQAMVARNNEYEPGGKHGAPITPSILDACREQMQPYEDAQTFADRLENMLGAAG